MTMLKGLHHVTAICGDAQRNVDFYAGLLGLRLVKRTVNFDDPATYHLYYGDGIGTPGTILTFFPWTQVPPLASARGATGTGQVDATALAVPIGSLDFWIDRLVTAGVDFEGPFERFGERVLALEDPDAMRLELVERDGGAARETWARSSVPAGHAIRGVHGVTAAVIGGTLTSSLLTNVLGFVAAGSDGNRHRFTVGEGNEAASFDLVVAPEMRRGSMGIGVVHHVAWRAPSAEAQLEWRDTLARDGRTVTEVLDRQYFTSIYFREPGGVLFEIATDGPGFDVDETIDALGSELKLPAWLEQQRSRIEARLPGLHAPSRPYYRRR